MGLRRNARELALLFLCGQDIRGDMERSAAELERDFTLFCEHFGEGDKPPKGDEFFLPFALRNWEIVRCWRFPHRREDDFCRWLAGNPAVRRYARELALGVCARLADLDRRIAARSRNWRLKRMPVVDRNIARIAAWELERGADVPPQVAINEALEIAKRYADPDAGPFLNGLLDGIRRDMAAPAQKPAD